MSQRVGNVSRLGVDRRTRRRDQVEKLLDLAHHLDEQDRLLVEQVYRHGLRVSDVARVTGDEPCQLRRHILRLVNQLRDPLFQFFVRHESLLPKAVGRTARQVVLQRRTLRQVATVAGLSLHEVREHMAVLRAVARHYNVRS